MGHYGYENGWWSKITEGIFLGALPFVEDVDKIANLGTASLPCLS